jgi:hypothetical protein
MEAKQSCPYSNFKNKMSNIASFFGAGRGEEEIVNTTKDTSGFSFDAEKGLELSNIKARPEVSKCPYSETQEKKEKAQKQSKSDDEEESQPSGGCPVMGQKRKDPENKHYQPYFEIPRFGQYDFLFVMPGGLEQEEFLEKTKKLRAMPRHLKQTLFFQAQEKLQMAHEKEFPVIFFMYDDLKEKGNRLFKKGKFREAIEHYIYSYGLLKWIQFKDKKRQQDFLKKPSLEAILDEDIEEKHVYLDNIKVEEDSFKACTVYLLMNLSSAYMELRHYSDSIDCLDECIQIAEEKVPDLFFRRSQARTFNKTSNQIELELAMQDIEKAISLKDEAIYKEHKETLQKILKERQDVIYENRERILTKVKKSYKKIKENNLEEKDVIYTKKGKDAHMQYKIIKE